MEADGACFQREPGSVLFRKKIDRKGIKGQICIHIMKNH